MENNSKEIYKEKFKNLRFYTIKADGSVDSFMRAWMMLEVQASGNINFLNKRGVKKEVTKCLKELCVMDFTPENEAEEEVLVEEWQDFAACYIDSCKNNKTYCSTVFGIFPIKEEGVAYKIAEDFVRIVKILPKNLGLEAETEKFANVVIDVYKGSFENGENYLAEALK